MKRCGLWAKATIGIVIVTIVTLVAVFLIRDEGSAPVMITAEAVDNEIKLVHYGPDPLKAGEWQYSVSITRDSYSWTDLHDTLYSLESLSLGTYTVGTYYVSVRYKPDGIIVLRNARVTVTA